ncbi:unnamed protein product, partial [Rotaria socialis]
STILILLIQQINNITIFSK